MNKNIEIKNIKRKGDKVFSLYAKCRDITKNEFIIIAHNILCAIRRKPHQRDEGEIENDGFKKSFLDFPKNFPHHLPGKIASREDFLYYRTYSGREILFQWEEYDNMCSCGIIMANFHEGSEVLASIILNKIAEFVFL